MKHEIGSLPECGYVRLATILRIIPESRSKIYADIKAWKFPAPEKRGRMSWWPVHKIRPFLPAEDQLNPDVTVRGGESENAFMVIAHEPSAEVA